MVLADYPGACMFARPNAEWIDSPHAHRNSRRWLVMLTVALHADDWCGRTA